MERLVLHSPSVDEGKRLVNRLCNPRNTEYSCITYKAPILPYVAKWVQSMLCRQLKSVYT